jgi:hypothetical protein
MNTQIKSSIKSALDGYAWPGGYPVYLIMADNGVLCPDCVKKNIRLIIKANLTGYCKDWQPVTAQINYEDADLYCDNCCKRIESAYNEN